MKIEQFDHLQNLVKETTDLVIKLKFENKTLRENNEKLRQKLANGADKSETKQKKLEKENIGLRQRQEKVTARLMHLRNKVKSLTEGVES